MLLSHLQSAGISESHSPALDGIDPIKLNAVKQHLTTSPKNCSSLGRLLDAIAFSIGAVKEHVEYEAQGPLVLEKLAEQNNHEFAFSFEIIKTHGDALNLDFTPAWIEFFEYQHSMSLVHSNNSWLARAWLNTFIKGFSQLVLAVRFNSGQTGPVILSGGCLQNRILSSGLKNALEQQDCQVLLHGMVPCNDAGISVGQAYGYACMQTRLEREYLACV